VNFNSTEQEKSCVFQIFIYGFCQIIPSLSSPRLVFNGICKLFCDFNDSNLCFRSYLHYRVFKLEQYTGIYFRMEKSVQVVISYYLPASCSFFAEYSQQVCLFAIGILKVPVVPVGVVDPDPD
jgi:hypothetical protein